jgi:hypothetical protein
VIIEPGASAPGFLFQLVLIRADSSPDGMNNAGEASYLLP